MQLGLCVCKVCQGDTAERAIQKDFRAMVTSRLLEEEVTFFGENSGISLEKLWSNCLLYRCQRNQAIYPLFPRVGSNDTSSTQSTL